MDEAIEQEKMEYIKKQIEMIEGIKKVTDLRGRRHGLKACIDIKICVDPFISVYMGHNIGEKAENLILSQIKNAKEVMVHIDPCDTKNCKGSCKE
ncbi:MAG: hypothetical protein N4A64_15760 [Marinisporobacter sp.]|jgi:divalent metal cation (Fe/Co/Zn/Cd) transporter|nr:hypothetical protein [Marinisporobacter sp.]